MLCFRWSLPTSTEANEVSASGLRPARGLERLRGWPQSPLVFFVYPQIHTTDRTLPHLPGLEDLGAQATPGTRALPRCCGVTPHLPLAVFRD